LRAVSGGGERLGGSRQRRLGGVGNRGADVGELVAVAPAAGAFQLLEDALVGVVGPDVGSVRGGGVVLASERPGAGVVAAPGDDDPVLGAVVGVVRAVGHLVVVERRPHDHHLAGAQLGDELVEHALVPFGSVG